MKILALDTALGACSAAVLDDNELLAHRFELMERGHAERIAPMVREVMQEAQLDFANIDRIAVTIGPGTFTGQRVGYAFARGLRLALKRPLIGLTTLAAMAEAALVETGAPGAVVLHDAKRGEIYALATIEGTIVLPVQLSTIDEALRAIREQPESLRAPLAFAGTAGALAAQKWRELGYRAVETTIRAPDAMWVGRLARTQPEPASLPRPLYLRAPDARLPGGGAG
ncbi:MAG TPA: tRNA (adenosine(37)-N6)-threonylcarbamoyltransferase complex dimerization subunit type 1 TsaB [Rhizomicrobium sp.]